MQSSTTRLEAAAEHALPSIGLAHLRAYAVMLMRYECANVRGVAAHELAGWIKALGESPDAAIERLARAGLIAPASILSAIVSQSKVQIQQMLGDRGLPQARTKVDGAKRLVDADPHGMRSFASKAALIEVTDAGRQIVEAFKEDERLAKSEAHTLALSALAEGRLEDARNIARLQEGRRVVGRSPMFSMEAPPRVLPLILELRPEILRDMPATSWELIRLPTAMNLLFGDPVGTWLPHGSLQHPHLKDDACCRMLLFAATHAATLEEYRRGGFVTGVKFLTGSDLTRVCSVCQADAGSVFPLDRAPALPHADCTCEIGCPCGIAPITS